MIGYARYCMIKNATAPNVFCKKGFSLLEIAVAVAVIGVFLGATLSFKTSIAREEKLEINEEKFVVVQEAVIAFLANQAGTSPARLPCPADASLAITNANFGISVDCTTTPGIYYGSVPTRTLGIDDEYALDAWSNKLGYIVDSSVDFQASATPAEGAIVVNDIDGTQLHSNQAFVLISHGETLSCDTTSSRLYSIQGVQVNSGSSTTNCPDNTSAPQEMINAALVDSPRAFGSNAVDDIMSYLRAEDIGRFCNVVDQNVCATSPIFGVDP